MLHFTIGLAFLILLLIPIGVFMISLIYTTGEELRKTTKDKRVKKAVHIKPIPRHERIKIVK